MGGHVFITRGDLTKLACDAWLLPTDVGFNVTNTWQTGKMLELSPHLKRLRCGETTPVAGWGTYGIRVQPIEPWTEAPAVPRPYLVNVGGYKGVAIDWYVEGVRQFFKAVAERHPSRPLPYRCKPLVALPLVGVGEGKAASEKGEMVRCLLPALYEAANNCDLDVAFVLWDNAAFIAAQIERHDFLEHTRAGTTIRYWPELNAGLKEHGERLAKAAVNGHLVLFLGAGVSMAAGLPSWEGLLERLADMAGMTVEERQAITSLQILDRARLIRSRLDQRNKDMGAAVRDVLTSKPYAFIHSLLASLPVSEVVTTNYDCLFEGASIGAGRPLRVLPYHRAAQQKRWLLKLHGCVDHPEDIVLTREDYLRYADTRAALAGIVQALLITRHMLFVGFSLTDDNFHRIVDDVRKASRGSDEQGSVNSPFGTALLLRHDALLEELWRDELTHVAMTTSPTSPADAAQTTAAGDGGANQQNLEAARRLEIFLDYLLAEASPASLPMLNPDYDGILSLEEREIRKLLLSIEREATANQEVVRAWPRIKELLAELGSMSAATGNDASPAKTQ